MSLQELIEAGAEPHLAQIYRAYIACLNQRDWDSLALFVDRDVIHNSHRLGLRGYRDMLDRSYDAIPDLYFDIRQLVVNSPYVACRLLFDCSPKGSFLGLPVNGRRIIFAENVFYEFRQGRIVEVWSVLDKVTIEAQLRSTP